MQVTYIIQQLVTIRVHLGQFSECFISHKTDFMAILEGSSSVITNGKEKFHPSLIPVPSFTHRISQNHHLHRGFARCVQADQRGQNLLILLFHQGFNAWQLKTENKSPHSQEDKQAIYTQVCFVNTKNGKGLREAGLVPRPWHRRRRRGRTLSRDPQPLLQPSAPACTAAEKHSLVCRENSAWLAGKTQPGLQGKTQPGLQGHCSTALQAAAFPPGSADSKIPHPRLSHQARANHSSAFFKSFNSIQLQLKHS